MLGKLFAVLFREPVFWLLRIQNWIRAVRAPEAELKNTVIHANSKQGNED